MTAMTFPDNFLWGTATASYQIEGAVHDGGRGETIWDRFAHTPGKIQGRDTGDTACDHYHRYREDVDAMKALGLKAYRFSTAWSRIFPEGKGRLNQSGIDFYSLLVDSLLENAITPALTLYHWDLPQALQDRGGWANRDTASYFTDYAVTLFERLGDRVKLWITHNEPWVTTFLGHAEGIHAPGIKDYAAALQVSHHLLLSHAKTVQAFRELDSVGKIGITLNLTPMYPATDAPEDRDTALLADGYFNRWFLDPVFRGSYPEDMLELYDGKYGAPKPEEGDMDLFGKANVDFLGVNYYMREIVRSPKRKDRLYDKVKPEGAKFTDMGWEIFPEGLHVLLTRLHREYSPPELYVTENGIACRDDLIDNVRIDDDDRIAFLRDHFSQAHRAIQDGVPLKGYFVWSLMDNFEWAYGYSKRFGLLYVDYPTQRRIRKKSDDWYQKVIENNGIE